MSIEIYWISGSAPAWRVLMTLAVKELCYESRILQTSKKEQKQPWFLKLNPRGQIPLLTDNGITVSESLAIMHYLERQYPGILLFGGSPKQNAKIEQTIHETLQYVDPCITEFVQPVFRDKVDQFDGDFELVAKRICKELRLIEQNLKAVEWLAGDFSAADIVLMPSIQRLLRAIAKNTTLAEKIGLGGLSSDYPNLHLWNKNIEALPAFNQTFPPHWR